MKNNKLERLLNLAKKETPPEVGLEFESRVMRVIRQESSVRPVSLLEQLSALFPRLALASILAIVLSATTDFVLTRASATDLASGVSSISEDWLFPTKGF
jgi:hypothetical protein